MAYYCCFICPIDVHGMHTERQKKLITSSQGQSLKLSQIAKGHFSKITETASLPGLIVKCELKNKENLGLTPNFSKSEKDITKLI